MLWQKRQCLTVITAASLKSPRHQHAANGEKPWGDMTAVTLTFTFGTLNTLNSFLSTLQEEHACLITPPVNKCNLLSDFCMQVCVVCLYSLITSALSAPRSFSSGSACYELSCKAKQRLILDFDAPVFVLLSSFCPDAEVFGAEGTQTLSTSITLPFPFGLLSFLQNNAGPISFAVKGGISVHFEICIRWACIITACTSLNVLSKKLDCLNVGFELKPSSHNDTSIASQGKQTAVSYPFYASNQSLTGNDPPFLLYYEYPLKYFFIFFFLYFSQLWQCFRVFLSL